MIFNLRLEQLDQINQYISNKINHNNCIVLLNGDLASGKTTLVASYTKHIGINAKVTSPTFSIQNIYDDKIYHYDMYNKTLEDFITLGLLEQFELNGIHFVEWGSDALKNMLIEYGFDILNITIQKHSCSRKYIIDD